MALVCTGFTGTQYHAVSRESESGSLVARFIHEAPLQRFALSCAKLGLLACVPPFCYQTVLVVVDSRERLLGCFSAIGRCVKHCGIIRAEVST